MKLSFVTSVLFISFLTTSNAQTSPPAAGEILKDAYRVAAKESKNVFVMFHASWCGWCHRMDKSMNDETCKKFFYDNYVVRHLVVDESDEKKNLENPGANEFRKKYFGEGQGIPFWLVFDKEGKLLADSKRRAEGEGPEAGNNIGCPASRQEVEYFISILKKTSNLSPAQLDIIRTRFRQNEQ